MATEITFNLDSYKHFDYLSPRISKQVAEEVLKNQEEKLNQFLDNNYNYDLLLPFFLFLIASKL